MSTVDVIGTIFKKKNKYGDFNRMIEQSIYSDALFIYNDEEVETAENITVNFKDATIELILDQALKNADLNYRVIDKVIVIVSSPGKTKKVGDIWNLSDILQCSTEMGYKVKVDGEGNVLEISRYSILPEEE